jgi:amidase
MIEGQAATLGFISFLKKPNATKNSSLVDMLLEGGAVLYVKTNVPQTLFVSSPPLPHHLLLMDFT